MDLTLNLPVASGVFLLAAAVVIVAAIALAKSGDVIASRTGWGRLWVGSLLLAGATSLPELVTNVTAVRIGAPALAAGNIFGANMLNVNNLTLVVALVGGRHAFQRVVPQQAMLSAMALVLTGFATVFAVTQLGTKWLGVSPASLVILGGYILGSRIMYRFSVGIEESDVDDDEPTHSLAWGWAVFLLCAAAIFAAAPFLALSADRIAELMGISESFMGALAVAIVTTLPELTTTITALRMGAYDLAFSGMYGSNAFNVAALAVADFFHTPDSLFAHLDASHVVAGLFAVLLMGLGTVQLLLRRPLKHLSLTEPSTALIVVLYLAGLSLVFQMGYFLS